MTHIFEGHFFSSFFLSLFCFCFIVAFVIVFVTVPMHSLRKYKGFFANATIFAYDKDKFNGHSSLFCRNCLFLIGLILNKVVAAAISNTNLPFWDRQNNQQWTMQSTYTAIDLCRFVGSAIFKAKTSQTNMHNSTQYKRADQKINQTHDGFLH